MSDLSEEKMEESSETKELVKKMNVDAVANVLVNMQIDNYKIKSEQVDLHPIVSRVTQDIAGLRAEINVLKAMGGRGTIGGTGSTVHMKGE
ncbi:MAG: hypothetical protein AAB439_01105 [Patescibacteria group bacterium]|mgnify:CR=1 FL=1